jgi:hypothetical protein
MLRRATSDPCAPGALEEKVVTKAKTDVMMWNPTANSSFGLEQTRRIEGRGAEAVTKSRVISHFCFLK